MPKGTRVQIINQPVKYAVEPDGKRYIEVHQPLSRSEQDDPQTMPLPLTKAIKRFINSDESDTALIKAALERRSGMPVLVNLGEAVSESDAITPQRAADEPKAQRAEVTTAQSEKTDRS